MFSMQLYSSRLYSLYVHEYYIGSDSECLGWLIMLLKFLLCYDRHDLCLVGVSVSLICLIYLSPVECDLIVCWLIDFSDFYVRLDESLV